MNLSLSYVKFSVATRPMWPHSVKADLKIKVIVMYCFNIPIYLVLSTFDSVPSLSGHKRSFPQIKWP